MTKDRRGLLKAPCVFCGYNGAGYWQNGTHHEQCPWHMIGGADERESKTRDLVGKLFRLGLAAEDYIDENPCDPDITAAQADAYAEYELALVEVRNFK